MPPFEPAQLNNGGKRDITLSLLFVVLSIVLLALPSHVQEEVAGAFRSSVLAPFLRIQESLRQANVRAVEMDDLQERLDAAEGALSGQGTLREENDRLRDLLDLRERGGPDFRAASVIRAGTRGSESMFMLDLGSADGVRVDDPVVSGDGLVGIVLEVSDRSALAMDWTHPDFRVSAMTVDGEAYGFIEPRHGAFREEDRLLLNGIPYYTSLEPGTAVVTSGRGGIYPRGVLVGSVADLAEAEAGWRRAYWVDPAVRPAGVTHVLVVVNGASRLPEEGLDLWVEPPAPDSTPGLLEEVMPGGAEIQGGAESDAPGAPGEEGEGLDRSVDLAGDIEGET